MKRKKWSELEEKTLLTKYAELLNSGALAKLKTREKKFKPIAEHVNSVHHLKDPTKFPFKWSWRDVSIKVQNMRHQYMGVKQKIRISNNVFNWDDGENHWENFLKYKEVFGDVELESKEKKPADASGLFDVHFGSGNGDDSDDSGGSGEDDRENGDDLNADDESGTKKSKKVLGFLGREVLGLREAIVRREEKRREREFAREKAQMEREEMQLASYSRKEKQREKRVDELECRVLKFEERKMNWAKREYERRLKLERELKEERERRMRMEEKREEEEMEWREKMIGLQIEHEKAMMQMHAVSCQNQMQFLGIMARFVCQFFGAGSEGLAGGLPSQVLQNLQHTGGLSDNGKPDDANSPSEFI